MVKVFVCLRVQHGHHDVHLVARVDIGVRGDVAVADCVDGVAVVVVIVVVDVVGDVGGEREHVQDYDEERHLRHVDDGGVGGGRAVELGRARVAADGHVKHGLPLAGPH